MTIYAGEELQVTTSVLGFDGEELNDSDVISVQAFIYDSTPTAVVNAANLLYNSTTKVWAYTWDTTGLLPGTYKAKIIVTGLDGKTSWEWKRIRLARDLVS